MSDEQENVAPVQSRIPRVQPSPAGKNAGIPKLGNAPVNVNKRKAPSSPAVPPAKRSVSGSSATATQAPAVGSTLRTSQRKPSSSNFVPTTTRKASGSLSRPASSASLGVSTRRAPAAIAKTGATASSSATSSAAARPRPATSLATRGTSSVAGGRPGSTLASRRPPVSGPAGPSTRSTTALAKSVGPGRGVSPGMVGFSKIGTGLASVEQIKTHDGRIENVEKMMGGFRDLLEREQAKISSLQMSQADLQNLLANTQNVEREARRDLTNASEEITAMKASHAREVDDLERQIVRKDREKERLEEEIKEGRDELRTERETVRELKQTLAQQATQHMTLSAQLTALQTQNSILQAEVERATLSVSAMKAELEVGRQRALDAEERAGDKIKQAQDEADRRVAEIEDELRAAESIRRKLHNQVQELKGNIRVFARVRPALAHESDSPDALAEIMYSDERKDAETGQSEMTVVSRTESAMGKGREQTSNFLFDKVFQPKAGQKEVFEEISMLAQSVLDGYNVCIFAYGQTGSGKSWTMEGGETEETLGMIPRAIDMIFRVSDHLKDRGWKYHMEGQFLEVYNEVVSINDLLGSGQFDTKKHEIKTLDGKVSVTDVVSIPLSNSRQVATLLERARSRRAVAATLMNERSSRSHSVFTLKVRGVNPLTDEKCEAMLNLVDLAGSERLASSGAGENKDRMKETININKSLSALADVIGALGQGQAGGHVPYRNSTLTRLLQTSLSGSSKTLMLCNLSPLAAHLGETLCSLRFATKVNSTVVGSAKKQLMK